MSDTLFLSIQTSNLMVESQIFKAPSNSRTQIDLNLITDGLLQHSDGVWRGRGTESVSYPAAGNNSCFAIEDGSFWFAHRNACLITLLRQFPAAGTFFDIGGGNGFVAAALQAEGKVPMVLIEPGADGIRHAQTRGVGTIVQATLKEAGFRDRSLPAIGFFDVLEHVEDEQEFLREIRRCLTATGRIYLTVPAGRWLWSDADVQAGHFRRYTFASLRRALDRAGFRILFMTKIFSPLPFPLFVSRSVPSLFGRRKQAVQSYSSQHRPRGNKFMEPVWRWELARLARKQSIPFGTSCLVVAESTS
jgi:SAM-dependent methyltransferase